ncbi:MAG: tyrosine recombinase XerC [Clostridiales bacterium]|jgi:site-specific recombinase XerD|nr:tyrosine recombinase XerC [Clostridiales bacterium]
MKKNYVNNKSEYPEILNKFITYIDTIKGKSPATAAAYCADIVTFFRYLIFTETNNAYDEKTWRDISVKNITLKHIRAVKIDDLYEYLAFLSRVRHNSAYSRARKISSLRTFYKYLYNNLRVLDDNPTELLEHPKIGKHQPKFLDLNQSIELLKAADTYNNPRDYLMLTLFLNCGLRVSELVSIDFNDIHSNTIVVTGKGDKQRTIYLNEACLRAFDNYVNHLKSKKVNIKDKKALFLNKNGTRISVRGVELIVKKYLKLAGISSKDYSVHKLRHTAATLMYQHGGVDVRALQEILGHEQLSTTQIYTHIDQKHLHEAVESNPLASIKAENKPTNNPKNNNDSGDEDN